MQNQLVGETITARKIASRNKNNAGNLSAPIRKAFWDETSNVEFPHAIQNREIVLKTSLFEKPDSSHWLEWAHFREAKIEKAGEKPERFFPGFFPTKQNQWFCGSHKALLCAKEKKLFPRFFFPAEKKLLSGLQSQ